MTSDDFLIRHSDLLQLGLLFGLLLLFAGAEGVRPRALAGPQRWSRWRTNVALYLLGLAVMFLAFDPLRVGAIRLGGMAGWGGLAAQPWPDGLKIGLGVLLVDLLQYGLHVLSHKVPWLWRLHKVHHSDVRFDASTALRHHPFEAVMGAVLLLALCAALGVPLLAILLYTALQLLHTVFAHANLRLPAGLDRWLRWLVVTPDVHRIHHSVRLDEGNANFGMVFPWWDLIFRSYRQYPVGGHEGMGFGLAGGERSGAGLAHALVLPFRTGTVSRDQRGRIMRPGDRNKRRHQEGKVG